MLKPKQKTSQLFFEIFFFFLLKHFTILTIRKLSNDNTSPVIQPKLNI